MALKIYFAIFSKFNYVNLRNHVHLNVGGSVSPSQRVPIRHYQSSYIYYQALDLLASFPWFN